MSVIIIRSDGILSPATPQHPESVNIAQQTTTMSTIATPRDPSNLRRTASATPSSSARPSLDVPSAATSPNPSVSKRSNRAALREYYNLRNSQQAATQPPTITTSPPPHSSSFSDPSPPETELDLPNFDPQLFITQSLESLSLSDLLRTYTKVLSEIRALDAEKKALVYDNYSKLITATETIRKMRTTMDPLNPMAGTLDLVVERVYKLAEGLRGEMRKELEEQKQSEKKEGQQQSKNRQETKRLAREVMRVPGRVKRLMEEGKEEEAQREWEVPRRLLVLWKEKGVGGDDVERLIEEGDEALRGNKGKEMEEP
ncbi:Vps51/Vps67-domain-containing protein [Cladorrhinum samala]|uniref:Vacuolar protein sorting-associated protein 51 homolog n=1 Tax=Cladorrhinum samala TaxID=585594 RepID=A0AAV9HRF1_9PEZI|nr:Vps51/Vps67-domain-containing protein [Cladorrhinum samala]